MRASNERAVGTGLRSRWEWIAVVLLGSWLPAATAVACSDDKDCKGDRICDRIVCVGPRQPPPDVPAVEALAPARKAAPPLATVHPPAAAAPAVAATPPETVQPPPLVVIEPLPPAAPAPAVTPVVTPIVTQALPTAPGPKADSAYDPALGFRCLLGQTACSFLVRPLALDWSQVDLHGDVLLGGLEGGEVGLGAGTRHWQLSGSASSFGMVFRWDDDLVLARAAPSGDVLLAVGLETGPKLGVSYAVSRDVAVEAALNGGIFLGYGFALNGGSDQAVIDGYVGVLLGARM